MKKFIDNLHLRTAGVPRRSRHRHVAAGDDLGRAIRTLKDNDTLVIAAGSYAVEGTLAVKRSTVIAGEAGARPRITVGSFRIGTGAEHLVLRGLDLTLGGKHLVDTPSEGSVEIGLIAIENCTVDLGGSTGAGLVGSRTSGTARNRIGEIRVEDLRGLQRRIPAALRLFGGQHLADRRGQKSGSATAPSPTWPGAPW